ncbi:hypothetical protein ACHAP3_001719 [Botrytis cinerea]
MSRINIPFDVITSRFNLSDRFSGVRSQSLSTRFANLKPVNEFFDFKRLSKPANFGEVQSRVNYNLGHFASNYFALFIMLSIYSLLTNLLLLFDIILAVGGMWAIGKLEGQDLNVAGFQATSSQLYTGLLIVAVPLGIIASPFTTLLWLIGASGVSIIGHASFMDKPIDEAFSGEASRVEELDSEGDTDTQGVGLHLGEKRFASDPLHFTGIDISSNTRPRRGYSYDEAERSSESDSEDSDYHDGGDKQLALRGDSEEAIVQGALARIRRAQEKGRQDVKLTQEELDALERRRIRMQAAAAAKAAKKGSSGSGAEKKRRSDRKTVDIASLMDPKPASDPKKRKSKRKSGSSSHSAAAGPGILVDGPDGPSYTPIGGYHPSDRGTSRSRSSARHGHSPPGTSRHFSDGMRPTSHNNSPRRSLPEEESWHSTNSKRTSLSSQYHVADPFDYQVTADQPPPVPQQYAQSSSGRHNYSGPADISYTSVRRSLPQGYAATDRIPSDSSLRYRTSPRGEREVITIPDSSEESDSADELANEVQVFPEERERVVSRRPAPVSGGGSGSGRRKGKGR